MSHPRRPRRSAPALALLTLVMLPTAAASAPPPDGASVQPAAVVDGVVTDASGGALPGAEIEAQRGLRTVARTTSGPDGAYRLDLPAAGAARLTARLDGFAAGVVDLEARDLPAGGAARADFRLDLAPLRDTVFVSASRTAEGAASVLASHTVFTEEDIRALGGSSVADVLRHAPGLSLEATGREGGLTSLFARGGEADYNHVLIDGVRVNQTGGAYDFSRVSAAEIERLEVVRGAQSALYGSDAIGSVIQIFTRRGAVDRGPRLAGSVEGGSFGSSRGDLRVLGGASGRFDYQAGVTYRGTEGAFAERLAEPDRFDQATVDANAGALLGDSTRLRAGVRYSSARGTAVGPIAYRPGDTGTSSDTADLTWRAGFDQRLSPRFDHAATLSHFRASRHSADAVRDPRQVVHALLSGEPGARWPAGPRLVRLLDAREFERLAADPAALSAGEFLARSGRFSGFDFLSDFETEVRRPAFRYQLNATWGQSQVLSAGYDFYRETNALADEQRVENHSWFVQQQLDLGNAWFVTGGARIDDNAHYGATVNPKLSAGGYPLAFRSGALSSLRVSANAGRGIRNPGFSELYGSRWVDGSLSLRPEQAVTVDAGAEMTFDDQRWLARVTWFRSDYTDQIAWSPSPGFGGDGIPDYVNIDGSRADGVELEAALQRPVGGLTASAWYALVDTEVVTNTSGSAQFRPGEPLLRRPRHSGGARVGWTRGRGSLHLDVRSIGARHDSAFLGLRRLSDGGPVDVIFNPGYALVGLGGQLRVRGGLTLFARVDNLTDAAYEGALGFPGLPRSFVAGGRFDLGG